MTESKENEILIGKVNRRKLHNVPWDKLGKDGFLIRNNGEI